MGSSRQSTHEAVAEVLWSMDRNVLLALEPPYVHLLIPERGAQLDGQAKRSGPGRVSAKPFRISFCLGVSAVQILKLANF